MKTKVGVIGCGNMNQAIVLGLYDKLPDSFEFITYTPSKVKAQSLAEGVNGNCASTPEDLSGCDVYLLGCKPQQFGEVAKDFSGTTSEDALVVSILAGTTVETIKQGLGVSSVIRVMPNTPALVGKGVSALYCEKGLDPLNKDLAHLILSSVGSVFELEREELMDLITPVSGSGPALVFEWTNILASFLKSGGLDEKQSLDMAIDTIIGSATLMKQNATNLSELESLRDQVTSKGGVTAVLLDTIAEEGQKELLQKALSSAKARSIELSKI